MTLQTLPFIIQISQIHQLIITQTPASMSMTTTELSLCQLNKQIAQITTRFTDNVTSFFYNIEKLLQTFETYLQFLPLKESNQTKYFRPQSDSYVFTEKLCIKSLVKFQNSIHLLISWNFEFIQEFKQLINQKPLKSRKEHHHFLSEVSLKEIIFLMYIGLEVERTEILGKDFDFNQKKIFLLKEVIQILQDYFESIEEYYQDPESMFSYNGFFINEEKLIEKLQQKTMKLKLMKENFSFSPLFCSLPKGSQKNKSKSIDQSIDEVLKKATDLEKNESLISVKSQFVESKCFDGKWQKVRRDMNDRPVKKEDSERKDSDQNKSSNEEIFKNISLNYE